MQWDSPKREYEVDNIEWLRTEDKVRKEQFLKLLADMICKNEGSEKKKGK